MQRTFGKLRRLKKISLDAISRVRLVLAIGAGLLLALAFPNWGVAGMAWIAPGLLLLSALGARGATAFRLGYVAGLAHHLVSLAWLLRIPVDFFPILGWVALSAFLALYPATWLWLCWKCFPRLTEPQRDAVPPVPDGVMEQTHKFVERFLGVAWPQRLLWSLLCGALWVTWEMVQGRFLSGFPWNFLGTSQYRMLPLIQIASFTGVYGVSFCVVWFSASLIGAMLVLLRQPHRRWVWQREMLPVVLSLSLVAALGWWKVISPPVTETTPLRIALVQPSVPQTMKWDPAANAESFRRLLALSELALAETVLTNRPALLVWPEAAVPEMVRYDEATYRAVTNLVLTHRVWLALGNDDVVASPTRTNYFNSSFLIAPDGRFAATYRKRRLVIFGEYVPLVDWLPFVKRLTPITGGFTSGDHAVAFELADLQVKAAVLICFEDTFPHAVRRDVEDDTDFLLNLTNNGWFGEGAAQWQHAANAVFRAVENGLPLVRCANNGLTGWVDARGSIQDVFRDTDGRIYGAGFQVVTVPVHPPGAKPPATFYRKHGDVFGWSCVAWSGVALGVNRFRGRRSKVNKITNA